LHTNVPLELSFFKPDWTRVVKQVTIPGQTAVFYLSLPFTPVYCALNYDSRIGDATSHEYTSIKSAGVKGFLLGKATVTVQNAGSDSSLFRIIHNYVRPDGFKYNPQGHRLSKEHFWKLEGIWSTGFLASIRLDYDGNKSLTGPNAYLDTSLTTVNGDSIGLFYRPDARSEWEWLRRAKKFKTGLRTGFFTADSIRPGEYAFGNLGDTLTIGIEYHEPRPFAKLYPNPASHTCRIEILEPTGTTSRLRIFGLDGKLVLSKKISGVTDIDLSTFSAGTYTVQIMNDGKALFTQKLIVE
jgi:hypothetical protein